MIADEYDLGSIRYSVAAFEVLRRQAGEGWAWIEYSEHFDAGEWDLRLWS